MTAALLGLAGAVFLSLLAQLHVAGPCRPRPLGWIAVALVVPVLPAALQALARMRRSGRWLEKCVGSPEATTRLNVLGILAGHGAILWPLGWAPWCLDSLLWRADALLGLLFLLLPAAGMALWLAPWQYLATRRAPEAWIKPAGPFLRWLAARARLILVPSAVLLVLVGLVGQLDSRGPLAGWTELYPALAAGAATILMMVLLVVSPFLILLAWRTVSVPPGQPREALLDLARRMGAPLKGIRLWAEGGSLSVNACALGLLRGTRRVVFTRGAWGLLDPDEILAVFSHEAGHFLRGHLWTFALLAAAFVLSVEPLQGLTRPWPEWAQGVALGVYAFVYWRFLFGFASRWCELEADVAGARAVGASTYARAMEKTFLLMGSRSGEGSWRHFSMRRRLALVKGPEDSWALVEHRCGSIRRAALGIAALAGAALSFCASGQIAEPAGTRCLKAAEIAIERAEDLWQGLQGPRTAWTGLERWISRSREDVRAQARSWLDRALEEMERAAAASPEAGVKRRIAALRIRLEELHRAELNAGFARNPSGWDFSAGRGEVPGEEPKGGLDP